MGQLISIMYPLLSSPEPSRFHFHKPENYISMYHQEGSDTMYVGGQAVIYVLTFTNRGVRDLQVHSLIFLCGADVWGGFSKGRHAL